MRQKNRFERYHATNRVDGLFEIDDGLGRSQDVALKVCMNCLERLNYKGSIDKQQKRVIFKSFSLNEFFQIIVPAFAICLKESMINQIAAM